MCPGEIPVALHDLRQKQGRLRVFRIEFEHAKQILPCPDKIAAVSHLPAGLLGGVDLEPGANEIRVRLLRQRLDHAIENVRAAGASFMFFQTSCASC